MHSESAKKWHQDKIREKKRKEAALIIHRKKKKRRKNDIVCWEEMNTLKLEWEFVSALLNHQFRNLRIISCNCHLLHETTEYEQIKRRYSTFETRTLKLYFPV